jgi:hypothetical protein
VRRFLWLLVFIPVLAWAAPAGNTGGPAAPGTGTGTSGGITIGAAITGSCGNGYAIYNNGGVIGCIALSGSGTVTTTSVVTANGFAGTVANPTTTPAITITTSVTGLMKGNGTAASAATAGTDYISPAGGTFTGEIVTLASATGGAGFNVPPGTAPTSPANGDMWSTSAGLFVRIAGVTVGPLLAGTIPTAANPSATAGPTANNGSAATFMRSDASPAVQLGTAAQKGIIQCDGSTITCTAGVISAVANGTVTSLTPGACIALTPNPITGTGSVAGTAPDSTKTLNYQIAPGDMCGQVNFNGSNLTVTIPAISSTVLAANMTVLITNYNASPLTISSAPTINGFSGTSIPQYGGINCTSNGTSLDCVGVGVLATQTVTTVYGSSNTQSGATYTIAASDCGKTIIGTDASAATYTIPASIVPAAGTTCIISVIQAGGSGKISVNGSAVSAATLQSAHSYTGTSGTQWSEITLTLSTIASTATAVLTGDGS